MVTSAKMWETLRKKKIIFHWIDDKDLGRKKILSQNIFATNFFLQKNFSVWEGFIRSRFDNSPFSDEFHFIEDKNSSN